MLPPVIFADMDGFVVDFVQGAIAYHKPEGLRPADVRWELESQFGKGKADFWEPLGYRFWADLVPHQDGMQVLQRLIRRYGTDRIGILTSPIATAGCVEGKKAWVARYLPELRSNLILGSAKHLISGPNKVLVDDHDLNIDKWNAAGGRSVLVPRPWNRERFSCVAGSVDFVVDATYERIVREVEACYHV